MLLSTTGIASAMVQGPIGPDFALFIPNEESAYECTSSMEFQDLDFVNMMGGEEIQARWNQDISKDALITGIKVYVLGRETNPEIKSNIQLWSSLAEDSLSEYQSFPQDEWTVLVFEDSRLIEEVQNRVGVESAIRLELDMEEDEDSGEDSNNVEIDYIWLEVGYIILGLPPYMDSFSVVNCEGETCLTCDCYNYPLYEQEGMGCETLPEILFSFDFPDAWIKPTCENDVYTSCHCHKIIEEEPIEIPGRPEILRNVNIPEFPFNWR